MMEIDECACVRSQITTMLPRAIVGGHIRCSPDEAVAEIDARRGTFFDPALADAFLRARNPRAFDAPSARGT